MNDKAQIQQVFIYLMAMIVIGFLVLFGYRMVNKLLDQKCDVEDQSFITKLTQDIDRSTRYGSRTLVKVNKPCDYQELCIVDNGSFGNSLPPPNDTAYPLISANTEDNIKYNIYLVKPDGDTLPVLYDERLKTRKDTSGSPLLCVPSSNGQFRFWMEGLGKQGVYAFKS